jgi:hypothetical protein
VLGSLFSCVVVHQAFSFAGVGTGFFAGGLVFFQEPVGFVLCFFFGISGVRSGSLCLVCGEEDGERERGGEVADR